jgi:hypothetical protein
MARMKKRFYLGLGLLILFCIAGYIFYLRRDKSLPIPTLKPSFIGNSTELKTTKIYATLDAPIEKGKNTIWCASFLCAWKSLETDLAKKPVSLEGSPELVDLLNKAADLRASIPQDILYTAVGWNDKGIIQKIHEDMKKKFPNAVLPEFPRIADNSFVAYGYLEASLKFAIPYFQSREPLIFTDFIGRQTEVNSFGIRKEDDYAYNELRHQPDILYLERNENYSPKEYIIDLDRTSEPIQIILALIEPQPTLQELIASLGEKIASEKVDTFDDYFGPRDILLIPDMTWRISHHYSEIEGKNFKNAPLKDQRLDVAEQDISFRLDRSGAELKSEAKDYCLPAETYYIFNRPFLIVMKVRNEKEPFFVMWVDNAELLNPWQPQ